MFFRYLVKGHTQSDGDSMYSRIESVARNRSIFTQTQWYYVMKEAKTEEPKYQVS